MYTPEQLKAIYTTDCDLLVAAAAGSGKTAVLVKRIIELITNPKKPVNIDRLLVVTFTDAAAKEMKERIYAAILEQLENLEQYEQFENETETSSYLSLAEHLQKQILLINKAQITTIHSFCLNVIRRNFNLIGIDPSFKIAERAEIELLKTEILQEIFEAEYENESFFDLVEIYGSKTSDGSLQSLVLKIYDFLRSMPFQNEWIYKNVEAFNIDDETPLDSTIWAKILKEQLKTSLYGVLKAYEKAIEIASLELFNYLPVITREKQSIVSIINLLEGECCTLEQLESRFLQFEFGRLKQIRDKEQFKEQFSKIRDNEIKKTIKFLKEKLFFKPVCLMKQDIKNTYPVLKELFSIVVKFSDEFQKIKRERNIADFSDLEHYCLQVLLDENGKLTQAAYELKDKYHQVLIDEYQDINSIQELILSSIAKDNPPNRFMVGDIKQSIYKFRQAKPELFMQKYNEFSENDDTLYRKINLSKNFRSRGVVLDFVNFLFMQLMTKEVGEVAYDEKAVLHLGAKFDDSIENVSDSVDVIVIDYKKQDEIQEIQEYEAILELSKAEVEARAVANKINEIINKKLLVLDKDKGEYRPAKYKDIVILMRSLSNTADVFSEQLKQMGIPAFVSSGGDYFASIEVMTALSFLQVIDNPRQDIHLITVLYCPVYNITSDELLEIRGNNKCCFYECILNYVEHPEYSEHLEYRALNINLLKKLKRFLSDLDKWRKMSVYIPINQLIDVVYDDTNYYNYVGAMPAGSIRQGNLQALRERAVQYETTSYRGLFHFMKYMEKLQQNSKDEADAKILSEQDDVVRIITIHKSKGLEFPIVFVSMLGKQFNAIDEKSPLILHSDLGLGPMYVNLEKRIKSNTLARAALIIKIHNESLSEELRTLYVALTRAKEKLILTGCVSSKKFSHLENLEKTEFPKHYMLSANCFFDWILPALARKESKFKQYPVKFKIQTKSSENIILECKTNENVIKQLSFNIPNVSAKDLSQVGKKFAWKYTFADDCGIPTKVSVSEIKRNYQKYFISNSSGDAGFNLYNTNIYRQPSFLSEQQSPSGAAMGTAIHSVMEHIDVNVHNSLSSIDSLIKKLVKQLILDEAEADLISRQKILNFVQSKIGQRMSKSNNIQKEMPFVIGVSPQEVYMKNVKSNSIVLVHGIIDCFFYEETEIVLIDYKSDYIKDINDISLIKEIKEKYKIQLTLYKKSIERSTGAKVKQCLLYLFSIDSFVELDV